MRLSEFIERNVETIVTEWERFARETMEPAQTMSKLALRDHASEILLAIAKDLRQPQTEDERRTKSQGLAPSHSSKTSAATHGILRHLVGFDLVQLTAEYRAVRATVLRLWMRLPKAIDEQVLEEIVRFNEAVDQALAESIASYSERVAHSRDTFLAVLGHDLRSPLSAVTSGLVVLGDKRSQEQQRSRALQIAQRSVASMRQMIVDLLEYTRTRLGRGIEIVAQAGDFAGLCRDVVEEVQAAHSDRAFDVQIPREIEAQFDADRMRQVITNLLSNAVQYGEPTSAVVITAAKGASETTLAVMNRGKLIPPDALQVIFDPLVQVQSTDSEAGGRAKTSLGLGLYIVREIMSAHGGTVSVSSTDSEGTVFTLHLPHRSNVRSQQTL